MSEETITIKTEEVKLHELTVRERSIYDTGFERGVAKKTDDNYDELSNRYDNLATAISAILVIIVLGIAIFCIVKWA